MFISDEIKPKNANASIIIELFIDKMLTSACCPWRCNYWGFYSIFFLTCTLLQIQLSVLLYFLRKFFNCSSFIISEYKLTMVVYFSSTKGLPKWTLVPCSLSMKLKIWSRSISSSPWSLCPASQRSWIYWSNIIITSSGCSLSFMDDTRCFIIRILLTSVFSRTEGSFGDQHIFWSFFSSIALFFNILTLIGFNQGSY